MCPIYSCEIKINTAGVRPRKGVWPIVTITLSLRDTGIKVNLK